MIQVRVLRAGRAEGCVGVMIEGWLFRGLTSRAYFPPVVQNTCLLHVPTCRAYFPPVVHNTCLPAEPTFPQWCTTRAYLQSLLSPSGAQHVPTCSTSRKAMRGQVAPWPPVPCLGTPQHRGSGSSMRAGQPYGGKARLGLEQQSRLSFPHVHQFLIPHAPVPDTPCTSP